MPQVPKRDDERVRGNKDIEPATSIPMEGPVTVPALGIDDPHPIVYELYYSLRESGQAKFYEPSDWQYARFTMTMMDRALKSTSGMSAVMLQSISRMMDQLMMTEPERRRNRLEVNRNQDLSEITEAADLFRQRFSRPAGSLGA